MVYLNNAATSYPKPEGVLDAVRRCLAEPPVEPGRSGAGPDPTVECRRELAALFAVDDPCRVILTASGTAGLNTVILGLLLQGRGGHVITTRLEHNSVLRPLEHLRAANALEVTHLEAGPDGAIDPHALRRALRSETRLVALTQASNVTGSVQDISAAAAVTAEAGIPFLVDAAQSAGAIAVNHKELPGRVFVAMAGHKSLYGPSGTGALIVPDGELGQVLTGGTGIHSESLLHPARLPLRHEAGTHNLSGIAGLTAGVRFVRERGLTALGAHRH